MKFLRILFPILACLAAWQSGCTEAKRVEAKEVKDDMAPVHKQVNRLSLSKSPFLKRHEVDLIDWYPWGPEAFKRARDENKPIMLVVGYSSCPWTLKMQQESYSDPKIAGYVNARFVCILVDREDQPDINSSYLRYAWLVSKRSGWPLHVWMTPTGLPLHVAIYLPKQATGQVATFEATVQHVNRDYKSDPKHYQRQAEFSFSNFKAQLAAMAAGDQKSVLDRKALDRAYEKLNSVFDPLNGGFATQPRFHQAAVLEFLLDYASLEKNAPFGRAERCHSMVTKSLDRIVAGALHDPLSGGFHRYCQDAVWAVPQFEKMLYDQGFLTSVLVRAYLVTKNSTYLDTARLTLEYVNSELNHPAGGFYCAENSFSPATTAEGAEMLEGAYYLWGLEEAQKALGPEHTPIMTAVFGLGERGNLPIESLQIQQNRYRYKNIPRIVTPIAEAAKALQIPEDAAKKLYEEGRKKMLEARRLRPRPPRDEKVLPAWNATVISAMAQAATPLQAPNFLQRAEKAAQFTLKAFTDLAYPRLRYSEDYAYFIQCLIDLYEVTGNASYLKSALELQERYTTELWDTAAGGFWDGPEQESLLLRLKTVDEAGEFCPNGVAGVNLVRLGNLTGEARFFRQAADLVTAFAGQVAVPEGGVVTPAAPATHVRFLRCYDMITRPGWQFCLNGDPASETWKQLQNVLLTHSRPNSSILYLDGQESQALLAVRNPKLAALAQPGKTAVICARKFEAEHMFESAADLQAFLLKEF